MERTKKNTNIVSVFTEGVKQHRFGEKAIIDRANKKDCFILNLSPDISRKFEKNFMLKDEVILLARDTSLWNSKKEGLVITNKRIVYMPKTLDPINKLYEICFDDIECVTFNASNLIFWNKANSCMPIDYHYFFKAKTKSYDTDLAARNLAKLLTMIAKFHFAPQA